MSLVTSRCGRTVWVVVLSPGTRSHLAACGETRSLLLALPGRRHLVSDYGLHETTRILDGAGLLGAFHSVVERGPERARDPAFLARANRTMAVLRHQTCVYIDADPGAVVAAMLLGWSGCLVAGTASGSTSADVPGGRRGRGGGCRGGGASSGVTTTLVRRAERRRHRDDQTRLGCGLWYTTRFDTVRDALHHYVFGTVVAVAQPPPPPPPPTPRTNPPSSLRCGASSSRRNDLRRRRRRLRVRWKDQVGTT